MFYPEKMLDPKDKKIKDRLRKPQLRDLEVPEEGPYLPNLFLPEGKKTLYKLKKAKGGLASLTKKKKFIPKIIKNKKLKKRKQQKPKGVGAALRGYGAICG